MANIQFDISQTPKKKKKQSAGKGRIRSALVAHLTENRMHLEMLFCSPLFAQSSDFGSVSFYRLVKK